MTMRRLLAAVLACSPLVCSSALAEEPSFNSVARSVTGTLVDRARDAVVVRDERGAAHRILLNENTRYVWTESGTVRDFAPGARVMAEYEATVDKPVATAVWILEPPRSTAAR